MSESPKTGVTVWTPTTAGRSFYEGAKGIRVQDGHLIVWQDGLNDAVAIFAPGKWTSADVK